MHMDAHGLECRAFPCSIRAELTSSSSYDRMKDAAEKKKNGEKQNFVSWELGIRFVDKSRISTFQKCSTEEGRRLTIELVSRTEI